ncbi:hypothetical protein K474DRAFT_1772419 [Panus rudis PR-1116 ss-1]|nr:hypothetical protein K474DRAFT_1772419 [Panus rudis PR-1116 ss-1]
MTKTLPTGSYLIRSKVDNKPVGSGPDKLGLTQVVVGVDGGYDFKRLDDGKYKVFLSGGKPTQVVEPGYIFAVDDADAPAERWVITAQPKEGPNVYTIQTEDKKVGWVTPGEDEYWQIAAKPLKYVNGRFPPSELYIIIPDSDKRDE